VKGESASDRKNDNLLELGFLNYSKDKSKEKCEEKETKIE